MKFSGKKRKILIGFSIVLIILVLILGWWEITAYNPSSKADNHLKSGERVIVEKNNWISFEPKTGAKKGFIFYPGAHVEPESYSPLAYNISTKGYRVIIVPMPLSLAIFGTGKASNIIEEHENIDKWIIGGHSLGGAMVARYANKNPNKIDGLVLLAAYPPEGDNLSEVDLEVLSIYGTRDNVLDKSKLIERRKLLPSDSNFVEINGANHAQFGNYGKQNGDGIATINRTKQQNLTVEKIVNLLENLE